MGWIYYLPEAIFFLSLAGLLYGIVEIIRANHAAKNGQVLCMDCNAPANKISRYPFLFLLPLSFGEEYENAEEYLSKHMSPISGVGQIPTGRRACRMELFECTKCSKRQVQITDFLLVRNVENIKGIYQFSYERFRSLTEKWEEEVQWGNGSGSAGNKKQKGKLNEGTSVKIYPDRPGE